MMRTVSRLLLALLALLGTLPANAKFELNKDDHIVVVGNTFDERLALSGYFDALAHSAFPDHRLVIRHVPNSADEVADRPREVNVPPAEYYLQRHEADVIVMCFGMSESFAGAAGLQQFEQDLAKQIDAFQKEKYNGESAPRLVLVSPIAHEDLGAPMPTGGAIEQHNRVLAAYTDAMKRVAQAKGVFFIDLFNTPVRADGAVQPPLTNNGIAPTEFGCFYYAAEMGRQLGWLDGDTQPGNADASDQLRRVAYDKHYHFRMRYRATNTEYVWGRRHEPYGSQNFPAELDQLERMVAAREAAMWVMDKPSPNQLFNRPPTGPAVWETTPTSRDYPEDTWTPPAIDAKGDENSVGDLNIKSPDEMLKTFKLPEGYVIECFASEQDFEELQNPLGMAFDYKGRLWVLCSPTYPHPMPGEQPDCKLLILEDTDQDGKADKRTIFARHLCIPTGFAIDADGSVYVGQAPDLFKLTDTDGDDVADRREIVYSGFGMPDSHHTIGAFEWDPNGGILMLEGVFMKTNLETPYGTKRTRDAAVWRFDPRTQRIEAVAHTGHPNPWGMTYDNFGQSIMMDTSGPSHYNFSGLITPYLFPDKPRNPSPVLSRGRPTSGNEIIYSRHFPEDVQGTHLTNQCIGFHGTRWDRLLEDGATHSGYTSTPMPQDLVQSSDTNFRPIAVEIGPDGSMFIADWCNPLIGHMQYNVRDPRRDRSHGRVWRVTYPSRPLVDLPHVADAATDQLLEMLKLPERNTRQLVRRRLQRTDPAVVVPAVTDWLFKQNPRDPDYDRLALEALWVLEGVGQIDAKVVDEVMRGRDPRARAGAVRVLRYALQYGDMAPADAQPFIAQAVNDRDMRVRLEAVNACAFLDSPTAKDLAALAANQPMDDALRIALEQTLKVLSAKFKNTPVGGADPTELFRLYDLPAEELAALVTDDMPVSVAQVALARADLPIHLRRAALDAVAEDGPARAAALVATTAHPLFDPAASARSVTPLLLELSPDALASISVELDGFLLSDQPALRSAAMALKVRSGASLSGLVSIDPAALVAAVTALPAEQAPSGLTEQLLELVDMKAIDAALGIGQAVRLTDDPTPLFKRLAGYVDQAQALGYDQWSDTHTLGMAALRGMHELPADRWPPGYDQYAVEPADPGFVAIGQAAYHDHETGCVKCHGENGEGAEGFPPLAKSPWVLGNPERAASIVIHGLTGEVQTHHDGPVFNAQMEPLTYMSKGEVAAVLTYIRQSWGNFAAPVSPAEVARAPRPKEGGMWHADDLLARYPLAYDRLLGSLPPPEARVQPWQAPTGGVVYMLVVVALINAAILIGTWLARPPGGGMGGGHGTPAMV